MDMARPWPWPVHDGLNFLHIHTHTETPTMKKKQQQLLLQHDNNKDLQIIKAVAQAWHSRSAASRSTTNEFDAFPYPRNFKSKPSRFKLEAMSKPSVNLQIKDNIATPNWDFAQSLWDSYELVTLAKKLETALVLDHPFSAVSEANSSIAQKRRKESKNSLRNLLKRVSSRRFNEADIPLEDKNAF